MRIAILYNKDNDDNIDVEEVVEVAQSVELVCNQLGFDVFCMPIPNSLDKLAQLVTNINVDLVFNLVESINGNSRLESLFPYMLEFCKVAYTGSSSFSLALGLEKCKTNNILNANGLPVPNSCLVTKDEKIDLLYPVIIKPSMEDASNGITFNNVVYNDADARIIIRHIIENYKQPAIVQEFIDGRELNVSILEVDNNIEVLSIGEIDFSLFPINKPKILTYNAKWKKDSEEYKGSNSIGANISYYLKGYLEYISKEVFKIMGLNGYGRIDFRLKQECPYIIDVNPNPDISLDSGLSLAASRSGIDYKSLIYNIIKSAKNRFKKE